MKELTVALGVAAALLHGLAYFLYNVQAKRGLSRPNIASWALWAFLASLNAVSYSSMSGDFVVALQFYMGSVACLATFLYVASIGKFSKLTSREWVLFLLGLSSIAVWWFYRSAAGANMIILLAISISFVPTYLGVMRHPYMEKPLPWVVWSMAYGITVLNVWLREAEPISFVNPIVLLIGHGLVGYLSRSTRVARIAGIVT